MLTPVVATGAGPGLEGWIDRETPGHFGWRSHTGHGESLHLGWKCAPLVQKHPVSGVEKG